MVELPIYNAIHALLFSKIGIFNLEIWGRLLTIFSALVTSTFLYLIGKRLMGKAGGFLTAFFYLFIPFNIYFTRVILPDPMGVTFGVISLWAFLKFVDDDSHPFLYVSAIFMALALLIKPYLAFYLFPIGYLAINRYGLKSILRNKSLLVKASIFLLISAAPFLIWRTWIGRYPEGIPFYEWAFNGDGIRFRPSFWFWIFGERLGHLILGSFGLIPFVFGVMNTKVKNWFVHTFLLGAFFYVVIVATANVRHDYYQILIIPAISLALSSGFIFLWDNTFFNKTLSRIVAIFSVMVMLITGFSLIKDNFNVNHPEIVEIGKRVDEITPKGALIVAPYNGDTAFLYQTNRSGWPAVDDSIDKIIARGADYYVSLDLGSSDTKTIEARFKTVEKTNRYIIIDLSKSLK
jgi:4-amino-4-deoxy-L-arabinose transferase-like glycosyltransferase